MQIYLSTTIDFENNGLGFLTDVISANVINSLNAEYQLELSYPINGHLSDCLVEENIIKSKVADGTYQLFRIKNVRKNIETINITAYHIFYDLLDNFLDDIFPRNLSARSFLQYILNNTQFSNNFQAVSNISDNKSARYVRKNPVEAIIGDDDNSMIKIFGGEVKRDNFTINFLSRIGSDNGVKLYLGKNITGIDISVDITSVATRIMPQGYDNLLLPELYVDSPLINAYPSPKIKKISFDNVKYDPEDSEAYHSLTDAYAELRRLTYELYQNGIDKPEINIKINWIELSKTNEYKVYSNLEKVNLGDTITAYIMGLDYETRVISTTYNPIIDMIESFEIGSVKPSIATSLNNIKESVDKVNPTAILTDAKNEATELITHAMGGYIYKTQTDLYIMDTNDPTTATKVWRWNLNGLGYSSNGINGPYELAMTMNGQIVADFITTGTLNTNVINGYGSLVTQVQQNTNDIGDRSLKTSTITQDISSLQSQISDIADITVSATTNEANIGIGELDNVASSYPIKIEIHPIGQNISYLYPSSGIYPGSNTFIKHRKIIFTNHSTNETFEYTLPQDLLYYDSSNYDEFIADYEANSCKIIKRCTIDSSGIVSLLPSPITTNYNFSEEIEANLDLTEGNYSVSLYGYSSGYLFVRLMAVNAYSAQYATKVELNSSIEQTVQSITSTVSQEYETKEDAYSKYSQIQQTTDGISSTVSTKVGTYEIISKINQSPEQVQILSNKILLSANDIIEIISGNSINLTSKNITINSTNFNVDKNGNLSCNNANISGTVNSNNGNIGGWSINSNGLANGSLFIKNNGYSNIYTYADMVIMRNYLLGIIDLSPNDISHYDLNNDGVVDSADLLLMRRMIIGS